MPSAFEQELRVVERAAVAFIDANRHHHSGLACRFANGASRIRRNRHGLLEQLVMLGTHCKWRFDEREVRIIGNDSLGERRELDALFAKFQDFLDDFIDGAFTAIEDRRNLDSCGADDFRHDEVPFAGARRIREVLVP